MCRNLQCLSVNRLAFWVSSVVLLDWFVGCVCVSGLLLGFVLLLLFFFWGAKRKSNKSYVCAYGA